MKEPLISRYCGIEDSHCEREISYQGNGTYFFAYPSGSHWRDFSGQLRDELGDRGTNVRRWEDIVQGELIFCKVCNGIHGHDMLLAEVTEANAKWYGGELSETDSIFIRNDGTLPDPRYVSKMFRRIVREAGLKRIRLHDLRHTYATLQRKAGQPIEVISRVLGHASEMVTLTIYNHWEGDLRAPADTMDLMLEKASQKQDEKALVRHSLEELERIETRPYRSRTCDTLIKRYKPLMLPGTSE